jgi:DNA replication and repair protein RecF
MGKTNLLDALYYLSFTKNYTNLTDSQLIKHDADFAVIQGYYRDGGETAEVYCGIRKKHKKIFRWNKKDYDRLSEHIGRVPAVMISPADSGLIQGGSEERRKFADMLVSQYDREYLQALIHYNKALQQRNALLRSPVPTETNAGLFEIWEEQMAAAGKIIREKRKDFMEQYLPVFNRYYSRIGTGQESIGMEYETLSEEESFASLLREKRERDKILGYTSVGMHKEDFHFLLDGHLIRKTGSQGQIKTFLIALKLAQYRLLVEKGSSTPILLLDDLFDKLDAERVERIIHLVTQPEFGQIFITDTNRKYLDEILAGIPYDYKLFQVNNGTVQE